MKELKYFNQLNDYTSNKDSFEYPTVGYVEENTNVYYKTKEKPYAIYRTTGDSQSVRLFGYDNSEVSSYIEKVTIAETGEVITGNSYAFATAGDHKVYIELKPDITDLGYYEGISSTSSNSTLFGFEGYSGVKELISISENLFSNCAKLQNCDGTFMSCSGLTNMPANLFKYNTAVTSFAGTFADCSGLTGSIPANLFSNNTKVTSFDSTFSGCTGLIGSIPENLFTNNTSVTSFTKTFSNCIGLIGSIPANLFQYNTSVTTFYHTFFNCRGLTGSIPENLFTNNTSVTSFTKTFYNCIGLTSIPENLFSNNTNVTSFYQTFQNCSGLIGSIPVDSDGTSIYNRSGSGKEGYAIVTNYADCFQGCTGLTDYDLIPEDWK